MFYLKLLVNEARIAYQRFGSVTDAQDPSSQEIPSIEINQLGLIGFNAADFADGDWTGGQPAAIPVQQYLPDY